MNNNLIDFKPFYRSAVGIDSILERLHHNSNVEQGYPPYNVEKTSEDNYVISMAVAGFSTDNIEVEYNKGSLHIKGKVEDNKESRHFLHKGIASRSFERVFTLEDYVEVTNAELQNGMLLINLERKVPEAEKPKRIKIKSN